MTQHTSRRKLESARLNGAKSRGPSTPAGKAVSSMNALRHGLTASRPLLPGESQECFDELLKEYMDEYEPVGPAERDLVHRMVVSKWREQRAWTVETAAFRSQMEPGESDPATCLSKTFASFTGNSRFLDCLYRHENAVTRRFDRAFDRLLDLQERRHAMPPTEIRVKWVDRRTPTTPPIAPTPPISSAPPADPSPSHDRQGAVPEATATTHAPPPSRYRTATVRKRPPQITEKVKRQNEPSPKNEHTVECPTTSPTGNQPRLEQYRLKDQHAL